MKLSDLEKRWIREINKEKAFNYFDLLAITKYYSQEKKSFLVPHKEKLLFERLVYQIELLLKKLSTQGLIHIVTDDDQEEVEFGKLVNEEDNPDEFIQEIYLNNLLVGYLNKVIIKDPSLEEFIKNDFKTDDEIHLDNEIRDRKIAQIIAIIIGILSIISAVVAPFIEHWLNGG